MAGGERERRGKKKQSRFSDRPRPKPSKDELQSLALKREGFCKVSRSSTSFSFCPRDGGKLTGNRLICSVCHEPWSTKFISEAGLSKNAHSIDTRDYHYSWRRKFLWRPTFTMHCGVKFTIEPPVPLSVFETIVSEDWPENAWKTSGGIKTHIRLLETTRAVDDFCRFENVNEGRGFGAAKLFGSGEIIMIVPPVEAVHIDSPVAGSRVQFTYGWVSMSEGGIISHAENMPEPAQGWDHVDARVRDHACEMLECEWEVSPTMVNRSEAFLAACYPTQEACLLARMERAEAGEHYIVPRPVLSVEGK
jgi:hypothetical protein